MGYEEADQPLLRVVGAEANRRCGHIALGLESGPPVVTLTEMGDRLSVWGWGTASAELDPESARDLAAELIAWADRRARVAEAS